MICASSFLLWSFRTQSKSLFPFSRICCWSTLFGIRHDLLQRKVIGAWHFNNSAIAKHATTSNTSSWGQEASCTLFHNQCTHVKVLECTNCEKNMLAEWDMHAGDKNSSVARAFNMLAVRTHWKKHAENPQLELALLITHYRIRNWPVPTEAW